jgi:hypothetical protein
VQTQTLPSCFSMLKRMKFGEDAVLFIGSLSKYYIYISKTFKKFAPLAWIVANSVDRSECKGDRRACALTKCGWPGCQQQQISQQQDSAACVKLIHSFSARVCRTRARCQINPLCPAEEECVARARTV